MRRSSAAVRRHAAAVIGAEPGTVGVSFWADSALLAAPGSRPCSSARAARALHAEVEWVDVASLEQCVEIYVAVASELCA